MSVDQLHIEVFKWKGKSWLRHDLKLKSFGFHSLYTNILYSWRAVSELIVMTTSPCRMWPRTSWYFLSRPGSMVGHSRIRRPIIYPTVSRVYSAMKSLVSFACFVVVSIWYLLRKTSLLRLIWWQFLRFSLLGTGRSLQVTGYSYSLMFQHWLRMSCERYDTMVKGQRFAIADICCASSILAW